MWQRLTLVLFFCVSASLARGAEPAVQPGAQQKTATSRITNVTVYQNTALVTREVDVPAGAGSFELIVTPLPAQTINNSLYSEGTDGIRVLTTRFRTRPVKEDTREEVRKLEAQLKDLQTTAQKLQAEIKTLEQNLLMLGKLEGFTAATTQQATEKGTLNGETIITLAKYVMDSRAEKAKELVSLQQQLQANQEQTEFARRQLQELTAGSSKTERDAVIVVEKSTPAAGTMRLNYLVDSAFWRPQYKLRAGKEAREPVQVEYLAAVVQQSGEDWRDVRLILSTAQPMLNAAPPELKLLEVSAVPMATTPPRAGGGPMPQQPGMMPGMMGRGQGFSQGGLERQAKDLRSQAQQDYNTKNTMEGGQRINEASALEQTIDLIVPKEELFANRSRLGSDPAREGQSVTYHLPTRFSVPSRNEEQVLEVAKIDMAPEYFYKAVPVLTPHVYRLANLMNKSQHVLLPGEATMYLGTDFVGRMDLPLVAIGEQFTAGFGVDPQLQVQRQMVDKSREMKGGNQVLKYDYRILVSSYKAEPIKLQVWDRLPHAQTEAVGVSLLKTSPEISSDSLYLREHRPHNLLRWDLKVEPAMNGEKALAIQYDFRLELDRQMAIGNFAVK
jgi:hypothetical protein